MRSDQKMILPRWSTAKLILGILSIVLFLFVALQSCAAGLGNALSNNGESSGSFGFLVAFNLLVTGIIAIVCRRSSGRAPWIISAILLWLNYFYGKMFGGSFSDLVIWGFLSYALGVFYLFSFVCSKKEAVLVGGISLIYLVIALI